MTDIDPTRELWANIERLKPRWDYTRVERAGVAAQFDLDPHRIAAAFSLPLAAIDELADWQHRCDLNDDPVPDGLYECTFIDQRSGGDVARFVFCVPIPDQWTRMSDVQRQHALDTLRSFPMPSPTEMRVHVAQHAHAQQQTPEETS